LGVEKKKEKAHGFVNSRRGEKELREDSEHRRSKIDSLYELIRSFQRRPTRRDLHKQGKRGASRLIGTTTQKVTIKVKGEDDAPSKKKKNDKKGNNYT